MAKTAFDSSSVQTKFSSLFGPAGIICRTTATGRQDLLRELVELLASQRGIGNVADAFKAVTAREESGPTLIAPGIALPHARLAGIAELVIAVATSAAGVDFGAGQKVKLVVLILAPKADPGLYLQAASSLAKVCQDPGTAEAVSQLQTPEEVWRFFDRGGVILPDYVCAGDIMDPQVVCLKEHDTLEHAIDTLLEQELLDVPVVDNDGDLVGVVTMYELLRVCLPDYILWMEDLAPVLHFEPFTEVLKKESQTWLAEVMSSDYASVGPDAPAIEVARQITKRGARQVFVLRGRRLVGLITVHQLIRKILRE